MELLIIHTQTSSSYYHYAVLMYVRVNEARCIKALFKNQPIDNEPRGQYRSVLQYMKRDHVQSDHWIRAACTRVIGQHSCFCFRFRKLRDFGRLATDNITHTHTHRPCRPADVCSYTHRMSLWSSCQQASAEAR